MSRLDVGATAAAINLGLTYRGCYYHLLASYDEGEVSRFGPGAAHLHDLMRYCRSSMDFSVFDFTIGDERYKRDWCDTELKLYDYSRRGQLARRACCGADAGRRKRLKRWIKQTPVLWSRGQQGPRAARIAPARPPVPRGRLARAACAIGAPR